MRRLASVLLLALAAAAGGAPAWAHAFLEAASPKVGARVASPPALVRLSFSEPVVPAFSTITVAGPPGFGGAEPARPVAGDPRVLVSGLKRPLPDGRYTVHWRVLSSDSHTTQGTFRFDVGRSEARR